MGRRLTGTMLSTMVSESSGCSSGVSSGSLFLSSGTKKNNDSQRSDSE